MQGNILIVDAIPTNRITLKVKLSAASYRVQQAGDIGTALLACASGRPDLILCAPSLPDGSAARLARRLAMDQSTPPPVLVVGPRLDDDARFELLSAGIADVVELPVPETLLMARVRSLLRGEAAAAEWSIRDDTRRALGLAEAGAEFGPGPNVRLIAPDRLQATLWKNALGRDLGAKMSLATPAAALNVEADNVPDIFVVGLGADEPDTALSLLASLRSYAATRHSAVLALQEVPDHPIAARALDLGADALMQAPFDVREIELRLKGLARRKRIADQLRATLRTGLQAALSDPLTGLHNRRYALPHLDRVVDRAAESGRPFAVMIADLDHFKRVNDTYGHAAGDAVLVETAERLRTNLRGVDLVARIGGEEFLIVLPGIACSAARTAARRICKLISDAPFDLPNGQAINATISIGLAMGGCEGGVTGAAALLQKADDALYAAKTRGRNCVRLDQSAA